MKRIDLEENESLELVYAGKLRLYITVVDAEDERFSHGFQIITDKTFLDQTTRRKLNDCNAGGIPAHSEEKPKALG